MGDYDIITPAAWEAMQTCPLFAGLGREMLTQVARTGKRILLRPNDQIIHAGERSNCMYLVCTGRLSCRVGDKEVKQLTKGNSFGDVAVYCDHIYRLHMEHATILGDAEALEKIVTRTADIVALEMCHVMEIGVSDLVSLFDRSPRLVYNIVHIAQAQLREAIDNNSDQARAAEGVISRLHPLVAAGFMRGVPTDQARSILNTVKVHPRTVKKSEVLVSAGNTGNSVFLVISGLFSCQVNGKEVRQFAPWQMFGEISLCASFPDLVYQCLPEGTSYNRLTEAISTCVVRTADIVCIEEGDVIEVPAAKVTECFSLSHKVFANVFEKAQERFLEAIAYGSLDAKTALRMLKKPRAESPMRTFDFTVDNPPPPPQGPLLNSRRAVRRRSSHANQLAQEFAQLRMADPDPAASAAAAAAAAAGTAGTAEGGGGGGGGGGGAAAAGPGAVPGLLRSDSD